MIEFNWRTYGTNPKEPYQNFVRHKNVICVQKLDIYKNFIESSVNNNKKTLNPKIFGVNYGSSARLVRAGHMYYFPQFYSIGNHNLCYSRIKFKKNSIISRK